MAERHRAEAPGGVLPGAGVGPSAGQDGPPPPLGMVPAAAPAAASRQNLSVRKAAALLRAAAVGADHGGATVSALARATDLPRATALRLIESLVAERLLARLPDDRIVLGTDLYHLARSADVTELVTDAARGVLEELVTQVQETVTLSVVMPDGTPSLVRQVDGPHLLGLTSWVGRPLPLHASSSGKILLAFSGPQRRAALLRGPLPRYSARTVTDPDRLEAELQRARADNVAEIVDELEEGVSSMSMGLLVAGDLYGSVNISGPSARFHAARRATAVEPLRAACARITTRLGGRP